MDRPQDRPDERLVSWKRIAQYLHCSERTARRWAAEARLPVHHHTDAPQSWVFAYRAELDAWLKKRSGPDCTAGPEARAGDPANPAIAPKAGDDGGKAERPPVNNPRSGRARIAAALLGLALAGFAFVWRGSDPLPIAHGRVEVGSFRVIGTEADDTDLSGFARSLEARTFATMSENGIRITAAASDSGPAMSELEVGGAVEGGGSKLRVTLNVLDKASGINLWSREFNRSVSEASVLREHVATKTARVLGCALEFRNDERGMAPSVLAAYMRLCATGVGIPIAHAKRLLEMDSESPTAKAIYGVLVAVNAIHKYTPVQHADVQRAKDYVRDVLASDPQNSLAQTALALFLRSEGKLAEHEEALLTAVSGNPPRMWWPAEHFLANHLRQVGRLEEAERVYENILMFNSLDAGGRTRLGWILAGRGEYHKAEFQFEQAAQIEPDSYEVHQRRFEIDLFYRDGQRAVQQTADKMHLRMRPSPEKHICFKNFVHARNEPSEERLAAVLATCTIVQPDWKARMYAIIGDLEHAYAAAGELSDSFATVMFFYREMEAFRRDPRFFPLAAKFGLVDYWLETGKWPDFCQAKDLPFDCAQRARAVQTSLAETD